MRFGPVPLEEAAGQILGHNVIDAEGRRLLRKGRSLTDADLATLRSLGRRTVWTAQLDAGDVLENEAAERVTAAAAAGAVRLTGPSTGRVNVHATHLGVLRVAAERLVELNECEGITLATAADRSVVHEGRMVGTTKILPYAVPSAVLERALAIAEEPLLEVRPLPAARAGLVVTGSAATVDRVAQGFATALGERLRNLGSELVQTHALVHDDRSTEETVEEALANAIAAMRDTEVDLLLVAGETAIQDAADQAPRALELAGGRVICFGAPVDPGNLLMLGELRGVPVVGAPGCARSPKRNIVDLVLPRLLVGETLTQRDLTLMGHGGLLEDVPERPLPRSRI